MVHRTSLIHRYVLKTSICEQIRLSVSAKKMSPGKDKVVWLHQIIYANWGWSNWLGDNYDQRCIINAVYWWRYFISVLLTFHLVNGCVKRPAVELGAIQAQNRTAGIKRWSPPEVIDFFTLHKLIWRRSCRKDSGPLWWRWNFYGSGMYFLN